MRRGLRGAPRHSVLELPQVDWEDYNDDELFDDDVLIDIPIQ